MSSNNLIRRCIQRYKFGKSVSALFVNTNYDKHKRKNAENKNITPFIIGSMLVGSTINDRFSKETDDESKVKETVKEAGEKRPDLPTYTAEEVSKHNNKSSFWVTYKYGVYDVTKFLPSHPGGAQIYNAAGLSIEPFWNVYGMHKTEEVYTLLESFRIGNLHDDDIVDHSDDELWAKEPFRDSRLVIKTEKPFNAEIPPKLQIASLDTPNNVFYVRQHMPVPELDATSHSFKVIIKDGQTKTMNFTLDELYNRFPRTSIRAALMCAGNRRSEMNKVKPVKGLNWAAGAISNAVWSGVYLRDVLIHCGVDTNNVDGMHVIFTGSDIDATGENFSTSIPLYMALDPNMKILLATEMNGVTLPPDHGYPLRVIVPGAPAVRSVKWLESITISVDESSSHWHQKDYRAFNPSKTWETADFPTAPPVYTLPVTSAICDPEDGETVLAKDGLIEVKGYAYSGGGAKVLRVDVTGDGGREWVEAEVIAQDAAPPRQHYSWLLWRAYLPVAEDQKQVNIWVKATDSNFNTQPENFNDIWNIRGILSNAYHKITVHVKHQ